MKLKKNMLALGLGLVGAFSQQSAVRANSFDVCYDDEDCFSICFEVCDNQDPQDWACCAGSPHFCDCQCPGAQPINPGNCPPLPPG
jgi:hypothetical protein